MINPKRGLCIWRESLSIIYSAFLAGNLDDTPPFLKALFITCSVFSRKAHRSRCIMFKGASFHRTRTLKIRDALSKVSWRKYIGLFSSCTRTLKNRDTLSKVLWREKMFPSDASSSYFDFAQRRFNPWLAQRDICNEKKVTYTWRKRALCICAVFVSPLCSSDLIPVYHNKRHTFSVENLVPFPLKVFFFTFESFFGTYKSLVWSLYITTRDIHVQKKDPNVKKKTFNGKKPLPFWKEQETSFPHEKNTLLFPYKGCNECLSLQMRERVSFSTRERKSIGLMGNRDPYMRTNRNNTYIWAKETYTWEKESRSLQSEERVFVSWGTEICTWGQIEKTGVYEQKRPTNEIESILFKKFTYEDKSKRHVPMCLKKKRIFLYMGICRCFLLIYTSLFMKNWDLHMRTNLKDTELHKKKIVCSCSVSKMHRMP